MRSTAEQNSNQVILDHRGLPVLEKSRQSLGNCVDHVWIPPDSAGGIDQLLAIIVQSPVVGRSSFRLSTVRPAELRPCLRQSTERIVSLAHPFACLPCFAEGISSPTEKFPKETPDPTCDVLLCEKHCKSEDEKHPKTSARILTHLNTLSSGPRHIRHWYLNTIPSTKEKVCQFKNVRHSA